MEHVAALRIELEVNCPKCGMPFDIAAEREEAKYIQMLLGIRTWISMYAFGERVEMGIVDVQCPNRLCTHEFTIFGIKLLK